METPFQHRTIRVLLLEDDPDDAILLEQELIRENDLTVQVECVDDRAAFEGRLGPDIDLIISDHALPQFNALEALELVKQRGLDVPFIIVSGAIREETAIEAMRRGAADYLLKDRPARLGQAVRNALLERQHRQEKERAAEAIRRSEVLKRSVLASLPAHIAVLSESGRIISVNEAWETYGIQNGNPTLERAGVCANYLDVCRQAADAGDATARKAFDGIQDVLHGRRPHFVMEYPCHTPTARCWFEMHVVPLHGSPQGGAVVAHTNVTERKQAEATTQHLAAIVSSSSDAILSLTPDGLITSWNRGAERLYGYAAAEIVGRSIDLLLPEASRVEMASLLERLGRGERIDPLETVRRTKAGHLIDVALTLSPIEDGTGRVTGVSSVARDISERKRAREALQESEARYRLLAEHATDLITRQTPEGVLVYASPAARHLLGYEPPELVGRSFAAFMHPDDVAALPGPHPADLTHSTTYQHTYRVRRKDGRFIWLETTGTVVWDVAANAVREVIGVSRDVTERKRYEQQLIEAREHAEEMSRLKSVFLSNMSHEIRTPLTAILGFAEILAETATGEEGEFARMIQAGGVRLMETLSSVLDLAQLEGGGIRIKKEPIDLAQRAQDALHLLGPQLRPSGLRVTTRFPSQPVYALADRGALDRILTNLLSNAIKFTKEGGITITAEERDGHGLLHVADTGVGISRDFLPKLFQEFEQESTGLGRDFEGNGLGLAISQRLAGLMDGTILVESEKGRGSTFTLQLPLAHAEVSAERASEEPPPALPPDRRRILLVEDNGETRQLLRHLLTPLHDLAVAGTAEEALDALRTARFDAVILDIDLGSQMTGEDVLRHLRGLPGYRAVPVIACTAYALPKDDARFLGAGFDAYLSKPFTRGQLLSVLHPPTGTAAARPAAS